MNRGKHQIGFDCQFIITGGGSGWWRRTAKVGVEGRPSSEEAVGRQARRQHMRLQEAQFLAKEDQWRTRGLVHSRGLKTVLLNKHSSIYQKNAEKWSYELCLLVESWAVIVNINYWIIKLWYEMIIIDHLQYPFINYIQWRIIGSWFAQCVELIRSIHWAIS